MSKLVIIEEKANKMANNLNMIAELANEMVECLYSSMEGYRDYDDEDDWDDEFEVKRRRGQRRGYRRGMRSGGSTSRF